MESDDTTFRVKRDPEPRASKARAEAYVCRLVAHGENQRTPESLVGLTLREYASSDDPDLR